MTIRAKPGIGQDNCRGKPWSTSSLVFFFTWLLLLLLFCVPQLINILFTYTDMRSALTVNGQKVKAKLPVWRSQHQRATDYMTHNTQFCTAAHMKHVDTHKPLRLVVAHMGMTLSIPPRRARGSPMESGVYREVSATHYFTLCSVCTQVAWCHDIYIYVFIHTVYISAYWSALPNGWRLVEHTSELSDGWTVRRSSVCCGYHSGLALRLVSATECSACNRVGK